MGWEFGLAGTEGPSRGANHAAFMLFGGPFGLLVHGRFGSFPSIPAGIVAETVVSAVASQTSLVTGSPSSPPVMLAPHQLGNAFARADRALRGLEGARLTTGGQIHGQPLATAVALRSSVASSGMSIAHIGDCRAYRACRGAIHALTKDHTVASELRARGEEVPEAARQELSRLPGRALGMSEEGADEPAVVEVREHRFEDGDAFLLCSPDLAAAVEGIGLADRMLDRSIGAVDACRGIVAAAAEAAGGNLDGLALLIR